MHLKRLELHGFKSFANKTEINFEKGITGVVGPNGSGKSNISDSIRWVLGEQSAKSLRGSKMEDIIFSGTTNRKPLGMAEVSITLDNSTKKLPIDYSEVTIRRRVYRSGESEYFLNKSSCRLKDIRELLMDTGIGKEGYSIIGQGKIDEILSNKPEDRRQIFEEASGIVKYKNRKNESETKLNATEENLLRVLDILHELEIQLKPLETQSLKAKEYKKLKEELLKLEVNLYIKEIDKTDYELKHIYEQINVLKDSISQQEKEKQIYIDELDKIKKTMDEFENKASSTKEEYYNTQKLIENTQGRINLKEEQFNNNNLNIERIEKEILHLKNTHVDTSRQLQEKREHFKIVSNKFDKITQNHENESENYNKLYDLIKEKESYIENSKAAIIEMLNETSNIRSDSRSLKTLIDTMEDRMTQVYEEQKKCKEKYKEKHKEIMFLKDEFEKVNLDSSKILRNIEQENNIKNELIKETKKISNEINILENKYRNKKTRKNIIKEMEEQHEGFNRSVKNILVACENNKELGKGVYGAIADLIKVPKGYETAIEIALGFNLQNIVSNNESDAKRLIEYLKRNNLGRITVLPITTIKGRAINNQELNAIQNMNDVEVAYDIISYDEKFKEIFSNLLSRVLIVPNLENGIKVAKTLNHRFKIVTLDGDVLNIGGSLTGGSSSGKGSSILGRKRELEDLVEEVRILARELTLKTKEDSEANEQIVGCEKQIEGLNKNLQEKRIKLATLTTNIEQATREHTELKNLYEHSTNEIKQINNTKNDTNHRYLELERKIKNFELEIENTKNKVNYNQKGLGDTKSKIDSLNSKLTQLKIELAKKDEQIRSISIEIETLESLVKKDQKDLKNKEDQLIEMNNVNGTYLEEIKDFKNQLNNNISRFKKYENILKDCEINKGIYIDKENQGRELLKQVESILMELQNSIHKLDVKRTRFEVQQQGFYTKLWEEYELTYNEALNLKEEIEDMTNINKDVKVIKDKIKNLGTINIEAIEEYEKIKDRYDFLKNQQEDLSQAKQSLMKIINEMQEIMEEQFSSNIKIIKENFNIVFKRLFGGGKADLIIEDEENILESGIEIIAQPPGKKLQTLSLLSGGERALTAISLLFGILLVKPSPFCVLDEIEAALDDSNVYRFAEFLEELSEQTQFIVVTHRKGTMESADVLYGVTMEDSGISTLVSVKLTENKKDEIAG